MAEKMSTLVLKVDLDCSKCYNKLRKILCQYHYEIRSQTVDRKNNTVTISGPFDPSSFSKKLLSKGGKVITGIEIKKPAEEKPKPKDSDTKPEKSKSDSKPDKPPADKPADKPPADKPADKPPAADKPASKPPADKPADKPPKEAAAAAEKPKSDAPKEGKPAAKGPEPGPEMKFVGSGSVLAYPWVQPYGAYPVPCYEVYSEGPSFLDYGRPVTSYETYGGANYCANYGGNYGANYGGSYVGNYGPNRGNEYGSDYFSEKNPACSIM